VHNRSSGETSLSYRKKLHRDVILSSLLTFVILFLLKLVVFNTKYLDPISQPLSDFQFTDLYYSQFQKNKTFIDTNIVLVNIGDNDRAALLQQLMIVQSFSPKVIGLDVTFLSQKNPEVDSVLKAMLHADVPVILTSNIGYEENDKAKKDFLLETNNPYFEKGKDEGFGNFLAEEGQTVRYYSPKLIKDGETIYAFTSKIVQAYDSTLLDILFSRNNKSEIINYKTNSFPKLDVSDVYGSADLSFLRGKIVLMGYMGPSFSQIVFEDNHLTPLNKSYGGHAIPDKYGVEIHANIISMVLGQNYINESPKWITYLIAFIVCMLHMYAFIFLFVHKHKWFHLGAKTIQLLSFALIVFVSLIVYGFLNVKLEPGYIVIGVLLSCDALYFYEAFVAYAHNRFGFQSLFLHEH